MSIPSLNDIISNKEHIKKLRAFGVYNICQLIKEWPNIAKTVEMNDKRVCLASKQALDICSEIVESEMQNGMDVYNREISDKFPKTITIMKEQLHPADMVEIWGSADGRLSTICLEACCKISYNLKDCVVMYVHSNSPVLPMQIGSICKEFIPESDLKDASRALIKNILLSHVNDIYQLLDLVYCIANGGYDKLKFIFIDCIYQFIAGYFTVESERYIEIVQTVIDALRTLTASRRITIIYTNHLVRDEISDSVKPALGKLWATLPTKRIYISPPDGVC
ncbi:unnamed protein product [Dimorphilus gyrociliatus]|uniref:Uncharacterized protein n=1 Tax=Dimorphilus gyrociliatus TaxID=2664684 RepID=A0A7I8VZS5_9ANNE|nr:unnamed protein product [Dimorphilus gyrociliatus]